MNLLKSIWWFITGRCEYCGGETYDWDDKRSFCNKCGKKQ